MRHRYKHTIPQVSIPKCTSTCMCGEHTRPQEAVESRAPGQGFTIGPGPSYSSAAYQLYVLKQVTLTQALKPSFHICKIKIIVLPTTKGAVKIQREKEYK